MELNTQTLSYCIISNHWNWSNPVVTFEKRNFNVGLQMKGVEYCPRPLRHAEREVSVCDEEKVNISILYLNTYIIMYQNVPIELIERIEALERRMEKN